MMNPDLRFQQRNWANAPDEEIFASKVYTTSEEDTEAWRKERAKRLEQKRLEQERIEQERNERRNAIKDAITYTDQIASEICSRISSGELLTVICREDHLPSITKCHQWLKEYDEFQELFNMSLKDRLLIFEEQVLEIADEIKNDFKTVIKNGKEKRVVAPDMVVRAKLRIEVRFRHLRAGKPEKWSDVSTLITKSDDRLDAATLSTAELEARLSDLDAKDRIVKAA
jgi:hypothetical protein